MSVSVEKIFAGPSFGSMARDLVSLTKPRLSAMVLFTCAGGLWMSGIHLSATVWVLTLLGTAGTVGAANAFNCFLERDSDRHMGRTSQRPLPASRMDPSFALAFALRLTLISLPALYFGGGPLAIGLGVLALVSYVLVYTPMKAMSSWAVVVGALPGALPPLMGWTAATGKISAGGIALFSILFVWQLPHFIAISLFRKDEYRRAGLHSVPLEQGDLFAWYAAVGCLVLMVPVSLLPFWAGIAGRLYFFSALLFSAGFLAAGIQGALQKTGKAARRLFGASLFYLLALFVVLGIDAAVR